MKIFFFLYINKKEMPCQFFFQELHITFTFLKMKLESYLNFLDDLNICLRLIIPRFFLFFVENWIVKLVWRRGVYGAMMK